LLESPFVCKITAYAGGDWLRNLVSEQYPHLQMAGHCDHYMEIWPKATNKAMAIRIVAAHYGIAMEEVMAIGAGDNDYDMLREAGLGVAMGQASNDVKACAKVVAPSLAEDGVAWAINKYVLNN
jgi:hydroxymethylpyrimidine pyrophosphatase-like HAD family hydrolase